jgi:predicted GIY-YIG superfamily endonuclease
MPFQAYIPRSQSTGRFYIDHTENLAKRIFEHNNSRTVSIKNRALWELVCSEPFETRAEAAPRDAIQSEGLLRLPYVVTDTP